MDRSLNLLGIARKAGLIAVGGDSSGTAARAGKAALIISASDASAASLRRAQINAGECGVTHIIVPYTKFELGNITGRGSPGTVAFLDAGLAAGFAKGLEGTQPGKYHEAAVLLAEKARAFAERKKPVPSVKRRSAL